MSLELTPDHSNLLFQIVVIFIATRISHSILHRFSIPSAISHIKTGILLGPTCMGQFKPFDLLFSPRSYEQLYTIAQFFKMLLLFIIGFKTDLGMIPKAGKKAFVVAICASFPFAIVLVIGLLFKSDIPSHFKQRFLIVNITSSWSMTSYTVVSCVLAELNLLTSKLGRLAMSATLITEFTNLFISVVIDSYLADSILMGMTSMATFIGFIAFYCACGEAIDDFRDTENNAGRENI